jgi:hypothetical protein
MLDGTLSGRVVGTPLVMSRWGESYAGGLVLLRQHGAFGVWGTPAPGTDRALSATRTQVLSRGNQCPGRYSRWPVFR